MPTHWTNLDHAGLLPMIFDNNDPRTAQEQADDRYAHGGGWRDFPGFTLVSNDDEGYAISYPEDSVQREISRSQLHDKTLVLFESSWLGVINKDGTLEAISRMD